MSISASRTAITRAQRARASGWRGEWQPLPGDLMVKLVAVFLSLVLCIYSSNSVARSEYWAGNGQPLRIKNDVAEWEAPGGRARIYISDDADMLKMGQSVFHIGEIYAN